MAIEYFAFTVLSAGAVVALRLRRRLDIIEVHTPPEFLVFAGLVPRLLGTRILMDVRDLSPHLWSARFGADSQSRVQRLLWIVVRTASRVSDATITVHEHYRQVLVDHGVQSEKVSVVMNVPDEALLAQIQMNGEPARRDDAFEVAYHGTITDWYGVDLLVRAVAELQHTLPNVRGLILGDGDALPKVTALARELGVDGSLTFSGRYLPIVETLRSVAGASCGVVPNRPGDLNRFILSNKLFEYIAVGIPVVAARLETISAHFDDDEVTFFEAGNTDSLVAALRWVAEHPEAAKEKARGAADRARQYSWSQQRRRYLETVGGATRQRRRLTYGAGV
jgi:glycosyltransferase involved in cell wall biosynthesis